MKKGFQNLTNVHLNRTLGAMTALFIPLALPAQSIAPQDSFINIPEVTLLPEASDGTFFSNPVLQTVSGVDLIYYEFVDGTNTRRGIRARDLDGNLVYEMLSPGYSAYDIYKFDVAADGTIYAFERQGGSNYFLYVYTPDVPPPSTPPASPNYSQSGVWGIGGVSDSTPFSAGITNYGLIKVSPVTGKVYVKEGTLIGFYDTDGDISIFDAAGNPDPASPLNINGILASTLEADLLDIFPVPGHDGTGELWIRGSVGGVGGTGSYSQWFKIFDEATLTFQRLFDMGSGTYAQVREDFVLTQSNTMVPITADSVSEYTGFLPSSSTVNLELILGRDSLNRIVYASSTTSATNIKIYNSHAFRTFDPRDQNAVPNVVVSKIEQQAGLTFVDVDFRVEDPDDATVEAHAVALPDGTLSILNALPMTDFQPAVTSDILGTAVPTNTRRSFTWNTATDWNVDFGDISVLVLAKDSRPNIFDVHLVEIPADGDRPAVTISRNPLQEYDLTMEWLWLIASGDSRISFAGGIISGTADADLFLGTTGVYDGQQFTDGSGKSTNLGRDFLLALDGLRVATQAELQRAKEGATEGFIVQLSPPKRLYTAKRSTSSSLPIVINEYGIESYLSNLGGSGGEQYNFSPGAVLGTGTTLFHVVPLP
ncbi:hypothetical protein G0Q06_00700 [Puniceicoccales bacterium CK1056]|uniref:Uncharacterized protein n=1 Tax=Oceanipulchritudo coccoides TaxID=2706888 RepID=A0A6B2LXH7_9BACT|nr:hypothetical protein [Oceanipulchritudo coccoides]NDV60963.1 hypothetical protein [Oceanipulchritudo coccoides]